MTITRAGLAARRHVASSKRGPWLNTVCLTNGVPSALSSTAQSSTSRHFFANTFENFFDECQNTKCRGGGVVGRGAGQGDSRVQSASPPSSSTRHVLTLPQTKIHDRTHEDFSLFEQQFASSTAVQERLAALTANVNELNDAVSHPEVAECSPVLLQCNN
jgi:hypothetical protein